MYTCQCEGFLMRQNCGVLFKEVAVFQRCPLSEVSFNRGFTVCVGMPKSWISGFM